VIADHQAGLVSYVLLHQYFLVIADLASQIDVNRNELADLLLDTGKNAEDIANLLIQIENNQDAIANLEQRITDAEAELELKQNMISGICPNGKAAVQIQEDGSLVCREISTANEDIVTVTKNSIEVAEAFAYPHCHKKAPLIIIAGSICTQVHTHIFIFSSWLDTLTIPCPSGYQLLSGGFQNVDRGIRIEESHPSGIDENSWFIEVSSDFLDFYQGTAICISIP